MGFEKYDLSPHLIIYSLFTLLALSNEIGKLESDHPISFLKFENQLNLE